MSQGTDAMPQYDWNDPEDRKALIASGVVWSQGTMAQAAAQAVIADPTLANRFTPDWVMAEVNAQRQAKQADPWESGDIQP